MQPAIRPSPNPHINLPGKLVRIVNFWSLKNLASPDAKAFDCRVCQTHFRNTYHHTHMVTATAAKLQAELLKTNTHTNTNGHITNQTGRRYTIQAAGVTHQAALRCCCC